MLTLRTRAGRTRTAVVAAVAALLLAIAVVGVGALRAQGADTYFTAVPDASALHPGDEVRVAGIPVGEVEEVAIEDDHVRVDFTIDREVKLGRTTVVEVKLASLFGKRYLEVRPSGPGRLDPGSEVDAVAQSPFTVQDLVTRAGVQLPKLDAAALQEAIGVLSDAFRDTPAPGRAALTNVARLASAVSAHDHELDRLISSAADVSETLAGQRRKLSQLLTNAAEVLAVVRARRTAIHDLLVELDLLAERVTRLVGDNQDALGDILASTATMTDLLRAHRAELAHLSRVFGPATRYLANATGNGPWMQVFAPYMLLPDSINCFSRGKCK